MTSVHPDILAALTSGIQSEVASYVFYLEASKKSEANRIKDVLQKLAAEEKQHFQVLERQYDSLVRSEKWISTADILKQEGLPEISEEMSSTHQALIDEVAETDSLSAILDIAYRLEVKARDLYTSSAGTADSPEGKKVFEQLAKFEEGHMKIISEMKEKYA
ncbi:MAG: ferritin family protein [Candidatus Zixiibacteriota bacterium]